MEFITHDKIKELSNPGVVSRQLINHENSDSKRVTITEVHLKIGAIQPRHRHNTSEQIWYALKGKGNYSLQMKWKWFFLQVMLSDLQIMTFTVY